MELEEGQQQQQQGGLTYFGIPPQPPPQLQQAAPPFPTHEIENRQDQHKQREEKPKGWNRTHLRKNLCVCEQVLKTSHEKRRSKCKLEEEKYDVDFPWYGNMVRLPENKTTKAYGNINRRARWLYHLGLTEDDLKNIRQPQVRWTHFPIECFDTNAFNRGIGRGMDDVNKDNAAPPRQRRTLLKVCDITKDTLEEDKIAFGQHAGRAITVPSNKFDGSSSMSSSSSSVSVATTAGNAQFLNSLNQQLMHGQEESDDESTHNNSSNGANFANEVAEELVNISNNQRQAAMKMVADRHKLNSLANKIDAAKQVLVKARRKFDPGSISQVDVRSVRSLLDQLETSLGVLNEKRSRSNTVSTKRRRLDNNQQQLSNLPGGGAPPPPPIAQ